jgi:hypothetical protein
MTTPQKMLPPFYQKALRAHLSESQYLTLQLLVMMLQSQRQIQLARLASVFPQPIQYESRIRNLQRFLLLPQLCVRLLWFPILKFWLRQEYQGRGLNRSQRRHLKQLKHRTEGYLVLALDRTQWKGRNLFMVTVVWGNHALPVYWELLPKEGSSNLATQVRLLKPAIHLFKPHPILVLGDREFHSPKLAQVLSQWNVDFCLRQKKNVHIQMGDSEVKAIQSMGFGPGMKTFLKQVRVGKADRIGPYNMAVYWKRKYRGKGGKEPWYILTSLGNLDKTLKFYRSRWGIESLFKDCKSGGYNMEQAKVHDPRFLALVLLIVIAYSLATCAGQMFKQVGVDVYVARLKEAERKHPRHSEFGMGLYGYAWCYGMEAWEQWAWSLMLLKPHKLRYFEKGLRALELVQATL